MEEQKTLYIISNQTDTAFANQIWQAICREQQEKEGFCQEAISMMVLSEEQWMVQKETLQKEKVLFIGPIDYMKYLPVKLHLRFEKYGIRYGWHDHWACLLTDTKKLRNRKVYQEFLKELQSWCPVDELVQRPKAIPPWQMIGLLCVALFIPFGSVLAGGKLVKNWYDNEKVVKKQQYLYGLMHLYRHHLGEFMDNSGK